MEGELPAAEGRQKGGGGRAPGSRGAVESELPVVEIELWAGAQAVEASRKKAVGTRSQGLARIRWQLGDTELTRLGDAVAPAPWMGS